MSPYVLRHAVFRSSNIVRTKYLLLLLLTIRCFPITCSNASPGVTRSVFTSESPISEHGVRRKDEFVTPTDEVAGCIGCRPGKEAPGLLISEGIRLLRIEKIKQEILRRLGLRAPPNITGSLGRFRALPEPLALDVSSSDPYEDEIDDTSEVDDQDYLADDPNLYPDEYDQMAQSNTKSVIIFSDPVENCSRKPNLKCFRFNLTGYDPSDLRAAELWIHARHDPRSARNRTLSVFERNETDQGHMSNIPALASTNIGQIGGWFEIDIKETVERWLKGGPGNRTVDVAVECKGCSVKYLVTDHNQPPNHRPYLTVKMTKRYRRTKRQGSSSVTGHCPSALPNCCKVHSLYVDFKKIGWTFITAPSGYHANYCHGTCAPTTLESVKRSLFSDGHSAVLSRINDFENRVELQPCCYPKSLSKLSLIYVNDRNEYIREELANMVVNSCACS